MESTATPINYYRVFLPCKIRTTRWSVTMQSENQLDVSITLSTFFLRNIGLWMSDDPGEQRRMRILLVYTVWILLLGMIINGRDLYFTFLYNGVSICFASYFSFFFFYGKLLINFRLWENIDFSKNLGKKNLMSCFFFWKGRGLKRYE